MATRRRQAPADGRRRGGRGHLGSQPFRSADDPVSHARTVATAARADRPLWICAVNEPSLYPRLAGMGRDDAVRLALTMTQVAKDHHPEVRVLSTDPLNGIGERQFEATDALVGAGIVDLIGVNYYPHTARRYKLPILVAETSWHDGHREQRRRFPGWNKGDWLRHVLSEILQAQAKGAVVIGACWYPIVDSPPWDRPGARQRWSHGLIRQDLALDPHLAPALAKGRQPPGQLGFDFGSTG